MAPVVPNADIPGRLSSSDEIEAEPDELSLVVERGHGELVLAGSGVVRGDQRAVVHAHPEEALLRGPDALERGFLLRSSV